MRLSRGNTGPVEDDVRDLDVLECVVIGGAVEVKASPTGDRLGDQFRRPRAANPELASNALGECRNT